MSTPFMAQLLLASFNFAPKGFAQCNGQLLPINQNQALFSLLGTTFGGDGRQNFGLPNMQGRIPMHMGNSHVLGERGGTETVTLTSSDVPTHSHFLQAVGGANLSKPTNAPMLAGGGLAIFTAAAALTPLNAAVVNTVGGSQPHENRQPFLTLNWCIALQGIFPSQN
jgi:microcystin-dependent protein